MNSSRVLVTILVLGAAVAGCGGRPSVQAGAGPVVLGSATFAGPIKAPVRYPNSGITLTVPAANAAAQATASWSDAYANCMSGAAICDATKPPTIALATATVDKAGTEGVNGSVVPLLNDTLVYVLSWIGVPCSPVGGPPGANSSAQKFSCTLLNLVDAKSGKVLYTVESPEP